MPPATGADLTVIHSRKVQGAPKQERKNQRGAHVHLQLHLHLSRTGLETRGQQEVNFKGTRASRAAPVELLHKAARAVHLSTAHAAACHAGPALRGRLLRLRVTGAGEGGAEAHGRLLSSAPLAGAGVGAGTGESAGRGGQGGIAPAMTACSARSMFSRPCGRATTAQHLGTWW